LSFSDYENPPEDFGFPMMMQVAEAKQRYGEENIVWIDPPKQPQAVVETSKNVPEHVLKQMLEMQGVSQTEINKALAKPAGVVKVAPKEIAQVVEGAKVQEQALQEFKVLLARYYANPKDERSKIAAEAVGNFVASLWPELVEKLSEAKQSFEKPKFSL